MDTDNISVLETDLNLAQQICASIIDPEKRNKAVANVVAAKIAAGYFDSSEYKVDTQTGLHNVIPVCEQFDISDIYVNDLYIDVRIYFSDDELCVPKIHFDAGILPVVYMFVKLSSDLKSASVTGFIYPESVNKNNLNGDVYVVNQSELSGFYDIEMRLHKQPEFKEIKDRQIYEFLEGTLDEIGTVELFKSLVLSKFARMNLIKFVNAQSVFNIVSTPLVNDNTSEQNLTASSGEVKDSDDEELDLSDDLEKLLSDSFDTEVVSDSSDVQSYTTEVTPSGADVIESLNAQDANQGQENSEDTSEELETLFNNEQNQAAPPTKKKGGLLPLLVVILILCGGFSFLYPRFANRSTDEDLNAQQQIEQEDGNMQEDEITEPLQNTEEAMPVETVEATQAVSNNEESNSVAIPAIEKNLDASVLVSNLKIDWEVPEGYAANTNAKRYFVKLGKIIQLSLKTELLLLNKPPLSNRITVELKYNANTSKFEVVGIQASSGEKSVDDVILQTVKNSLSSSVSANMEAFARLQGNPVLIIHL